MTTFVLVHGAWGGSYGWTKFAGMLRADGHDVFTPSLTGQGERNHLGGPNIGLTTHITDVENTIKYEDLDKFVLVGHSYGGMVITGLADRLPDQITDQYRQRNRSAAPQSRATQEAICTSTSP